MCEIEKDKQLAKMTQTKGGRPWKYPYQYMEVGDSFSVPHKTASDISGSLNYANKHLYPKNFKAGLYDEKGNRVLKNGAPAVRIIRIV